MKRNRLQMRKRRHLRLRSKLAGTPARPRLMVRKSLRHLYVQVFDDSVEGGTKTLFAASTAAAGKGAEPTHKCNATNAAEFGKQIGAALKAKGLDTLVFDRGGYRYHGIVKALADGVRESGINM